MHLFYKSKVFPCAFTLYVSLKSCLHKLDSRGLCRILIPLKEPKSKIQNSNPQNFCKFAQKKPPRRLNSCTENEQKGPESPQQFDVYLTSKNTDISKAGFLPPTSLSRVDMSDIFQGCLTSDEVWPFSQSKPSFPSQ